MLSIDSDLGRHLTLGNYILDERIIPTTDLFSYTRAGASRPPYEWLSQVIFALSFRTVKLSGVVFVTALVISITYMLLFRTSWKKSGSVLITMVYIVLAIAASSIHWLPRPHIFTFLLLPIWTEHIEQSTSGKPKFHITFGLMLLWANLHGGFIFGFLVWLSYLTGSIWEAKRNYSGIISAKTVLYSGLIALLASVMTPDLWHNWTAVLNNQSQFILERTVETQPPKLLEAIFLPFTMLLGVTLLIFIKSWNGLKTSHAFLLLGMGTAAIAMSRNIPLFSMVAIPILSKHTSQLLDHSQIWLTIEKRFGNMESTKLHILIPLVLVLFTTIFLIKQNKVRELYYFDERVFPVQAADFIIETPPPGNMLNDFNWGGYMIFRLYPIDKVFLDSQTDFYGEELVREYDALIQLNKNWEEILKRHQITWAVLPIDSPLSQALTSKLHWKIAYRDSTAVVLKQP